MTRARTIAVAYASIGSGHRIAAEALATELAGRDGGSLRVESLDVLEYAKPAVSGNLLTSSFTGATAGVYDAVWASPATGALARTLAAPFLGMMFSSFVRRLVELRPDAVVCTHALAALLATRAQRHSDLAVVNVATDYGVHGFWPRDGVSLFCVADEASLESLLDRGFAESQIAVTGVPVRRQFTLDYDCEAARRHFDLPLESRVVLALAGSTMPGPYERFKEALAVSLPALATLPNTAVAVIAGRDELFAEEMRTRSAGFGTTNVHVFGFVEQIAPLISCSDLALAKPGGAVCAECLASGIPLVLVGPAAGQERANAKALTDAGAATFAADPRTIAEYARKVIAKPPRLKALREAAEKYARPFAAADIADRVLALGPRL